MGFSYHLLFFLLIIYLYFSCLANGELDCIFFFKSKYECYGFPFRAYIYIYIYSDVCRSEHVPIKLTILST
jgi:hypothetical protein